MKLVIALALALVVFALVRARICKLLAGKGTRARLGQRAILAHLHKKFMPCHINWNATASISR